MLLCIFLQNLIILIFKQIFISGSIRFAEEKELIVSQCLYMLCQPFRDNRGSSVINFLLNYGFHDISENEKKFWTKHADMLINFLDCMHRIFIYFYIIVLIKN